jgi:hypothetical protein
MRIKFPINTNLTNMEIFEEIIKCKKLVTEVTVSLKHYIYLCYILSLKKIFFKSVLYIKNPEKENNIYLIKFYDDNNNTPLILIKDI